MQSSRKLAPLAAPATTLPPRGKGSRYALVPLEVAGHPLGAPQAQGKQGESGGDGANDEKGFGRHAASPLQEGRRIRDRERGSLDRSQFDQLRSAPGRGPHPP